MFYYKICVKMVMFFVNCILNFSFCSAESNLGKEERDLIIISTESTLMREIVLNNTVKDDSQILREKTSIDRSKIGSLT